MTLEDVRIEYRTLRIGFCVRNNNIDDVIVASKLNTLLWGGAYNPIIPVGAPDELDHQLMRLFQVDVLIPIFESQEIKDFIEKYKWARFPLSYHTNSIFSEDAYQRDKKVVTVLDVSQIIRKLWDKDFKFIKTGNSNCAFPKWKQSDPDKNLFTLIFGEYPDEKLLFKYEENYKKALRAVEIKIEKAKSVPVKLATTISPIALTEHEIKQYGGRRIEAGIYVGDKNDFLDLVNFWNIRASGSYITFLSKTNSKRFLPYVRAHIGRITKPSNFDKRPAVHVWFKGETEGDFKKVQTIIKPLQNKNRLFGMSSVSGHSWNGLNIIPNYNVLGEATALASVSAKYGKPRIGFQLLNNPVPKEQEKSFRHQYFVISVRPSVGVDFSEYTTSLPVLPDLNEWYARQMVFDPFSLRVVKTHLGKTVALITEADTETIELSPINKFDVIKKVFERAGIVAEKSGAGLIAERLIALMDGITGSSRIFKITGVRKFIEETNPLHQKTKYEIVEKIRDDDSFKNFENEFGLKGRTPMTTDDVFETLIERNLIQTGIETRCPKCGIKTWINLKEVDEFYNCEYCYQKSKFIEVVEPIEIKSGDEVKKVDGTRWSYRLSGLLGRQDKQQGAIPVILTLQHLSNRLHAGHSENLFSTALDLKFTENGKQEKAETDLVILDLAEIMRKDDIEILIGECKTGQTISKEQIERLEKVKELVEKSGIKCHLVFVKTKKGFSTSEINHFKKLYAKGTKPLLFTSNELEHWWDEYKNFKVKKLDFKLPFEHPFTFGELAENSAYVYNLV